MSKTKKAGHIEELNSSISFSSHYKALISFEACQGLLISLDMPSCTEKKNGHLHTRKQV